MVQPRGDPGDRGALGRRFRAIMTRPRPGGLPMPTESTPSLCPIGLVGLAVMGENLALNIEEKGFPIAVFNRTVSKVDDFLARNPGKQLHGCHSIEEFVAAIELSRPIILLVKAGEAVQGMIAASR